MTDSARLTGNTAARNCADDIELLNRIGKSERLTNYQLKSVQTEIVVYSSAVDSETLTLATECFLLPVP